MDKIEKRNLIIAIIISLILIISVIIYEISAHLTSSNNNKIEIVTNNSRFFTVSSCVNRYLSYLSNDDVKNILLLIDDNYKKNNNINENNVLKKIKNYSGIKEFSAKKMFEEKINNDYYRYYVYGEISDISLNEDINARVNVEDFYVIVNINNTNYTYSIIPYDGKIFKEKKNG